MDFKQYIRNIPDFPKPGIQFKDITPLLLDPSAFREAIIAMAAPFKSEGIQYVAGAEARGFLFGPSIATLLNAGFVPVRKPGKLPGQVLTCEYELEYGKDALQMHKGQIPSGSRVLIIDDLLATGGTMAATKELIEMHGAITVGFSFLIELSFLAGRKKIGSDKVFSLVNYSGD